MIREDELRDILSETAAAIAGSDRNPSTWLRSLTYLLAQLEQQALDSNPLHEQLFKDMLAYLQDKIRNYQRTGGW